MARQEIKITVTLMSGERNEISILPTHGAQDVISVLVQDGKLPAQDSVGRVLQYELVDERTMTVLAGDRPLVEQGVVNGAQLRVKPGARVALEAAPW
jgi:hypothetical protein